MAFLPDELAYAVAAWVHFEALCKRTSLFSERYLAHPIGQYLIACEGSVVEPEVSHPALAGRRADFAIKNPNHSLRDIFETKFVTAGRDFTQEIFYDPIRLESASPLLSGGSAWLLIAGLGERIKEDVLEEPGPVGPADPPFQAILGPSLGDPPRVVDIQGSVDPSRGCWRAACVKVGLADCPARMLVELLGQAPIDPAIGDDKWTCLVWKISHANPRATFQF
jgi:hypothetical protein